MCGIVGYIGYKEASPILLEGLERLSYRGYDSAGVAVAKADGTLQVKKAKGRLDNLKALLNAEPVEGMAGIGHTRWATHGEPSTIATRMALMPPSKPKRSARAPTTVGIRIAPEEPMARMMLVAMG